jgi:hypothetical protein
MPIGETDSLEVINEIERLSRRIRNMLDSPLADELSFLGPELTESDRRELHRARVVFALHDLQKLAGTLAVRLSEEPRP